MLFLELLFIKIKRKYLKNLFEVHWFYMLVAVVLVSAKYAMFKVFNLKRIVNRLFLFFRKSWVNIVSIIFFNHVHNTFIDKHTYWKTIIHLCITLLVETYCGGFRVPRLIYGPLRIIYMVLRGPEWCLVYFMPPIPHSRNKKVGHKNLFCWIEKNLIF